MQSWEAVVTLDQAPSTPPTSIHAPRFALPKSDNQLVVFAITRYRLPILYTMAPLKPGTKVVPQKLRRNERERKRVNQINLGFDKLRERVPKVASNKKLSKADTIREATKYIQYLQTLLNTEGSYAPSSSSPNSSMIGDASGLHMDMLDMHVEMAPVDNTQYQYASWQQDCYYQASPVSSHSSYSSPQHPQQQPYICYQAQESMPSH